MEQNNENEIVISNQFDYSNIVVEVQPLSYLVQYCDSLYKQLVKMVDEDEQKNEKLKYEYQNYQYKKSYSSKFEVSIVERNPNYNSIVCKSYESFKEAVDGGHLKNIDSITLILNMSYKRGNNATMQNHENEFKVVFKPYDIKFFRKSNYNENDMNYIENNFNNILKQFKVQNSIFCTKE